MKPPRRKAWTGFIPGSPGGATCPGRGGIGRGLAGLSPAIKTGHQDRGRTWEDKPEEERAINSRGGLVEKINELEYRKWCENCGKKFYTVNRDKKLCRRCCRKKVAGKGYPPLSFRKGCGGGGRHRTDKEKTTSCSETLECPHCGSLAILTGFRFQRDPADRPDQGRWRYYIRCENCGRYETKYYNSREEAIEAFKEVEAV